MRVVRLCILLESAMIASEGKECDSVCMAVLLNRVGRAQAVR